MSHRIKKGRIIKLRNKKTGRIIKLKQKDFLKGPFRFKRLVMMSNRPRRNELATKRRSMV